MCQTIAMLTRRGELPRDATAAFLRDGYAQLEPQAGLLVWSGWIDAVAWLGLSELTPLVQEAFERGSIDPMWLTFKEFEEDLQYSIDHPEAEPLNADGRDHAVRRHGRGNVVVGSISSRKHRATATIRMGAVEFLIEMPAREPLRQSRTQRSLSLRQRKKIQEMLPERSGRTTIGKRAALGACRTVAA